MNLDIRAARPEDWRAVRDLRLRALEDSPDAFGSTLERELRFAEADWLGWITGWNGGRNHFVVASIEGEWLAMAVGSRAADDPIAHLYGMWVAPSARRLGLGTGLVDEVLGWAASVGAAEIELGVTETNAGARALYETKGFLDTGARHPLRPGSTLQEIVMRRTVSTTT